MLRYHPFLHSIVVLTCLAGCSDSPVSEKSGDANPTTQNPASTDDVPVESALLKKELIDATVELMQAQNPDADPNELRGQVQQMLDKEIGKIRTIYPEFLIVSPETEEKLRAGTPTQDSAKRIADAESFLSESGITTSLLVQALLPQHKTGTLTPVRTEVLAQVIVADRKKLEDALTNGDSAAPAAQATAILVDMDGVRHRLPQAEANFLAGLTSAKPDVDTTDHLSLDPPYRVIVDGVDLALEPDELILMHRGGTRQWNSSGVRARILAAAKIQ